MSAIALQTARSALRGLSLAESARERRLSILIFHRVRTHTDLLFPDEVDADWFDQCMALVAASCRVLTLHHAASALVRGELPPRAVVITFDDGYADNAEVALPILQRHGLPATFFVSSGFLDGGRMWNDTVIETVRRASVASADLSAFGLTHQPLSSVADRRGAVDALLSRIKYLALEQREDALRRLAALLKPTALPDDLMMRSDQVRLLHQQGMEIGGHTVNHPILARTEPAQALQEIVQGKQALQALIDAPVTTFAYPNGGPDTDYSASHVAMVRQAGFLAAVSTADGVAGKASSCFELPRFSPWDRSLNRWALRLAIHRLRAGSGRTARAPDA